MLEGPLISRYLFHAQPQQGQERQLMIDWEEDSTTILLQSKWPAVMTAGENSSVLQKSYCCPLDLTP
jgi:hypothetical protein